MKALYDAEIIHLVLSDKSLIGPSVIDLIILPKSGPKTKSDKIYIIKI